MASQLVFITGVTGHAGFRVLVSALEAGYRVRASIRKPEQADLVRSTESVKPYSAQLEFVVVPDILKDGAFVEHLAGVDYVIHVASPLPVPTDNLDRDIVIPAIKGTTTMLQDAAQFKTIKRVVITSSVVAVIPSEYFDTVSTDQEFDDNSRRSKPELGSYNDPPSAYRAAKALAWYATEDFISQRKPHFDVVNIGPSYIIGKNELIKSPQRIMDGSNAVVMANILGISYPRKAAGTTVHVNDVGKAHVLALNPKVPGNQTYLLNSLGTESVDLNKTLEVASANFPDAVQKGVLPLGGHTETLKLKIDGSHAEKVLGFSYAPFDEQVKSVVGHYVELVEATGEKFGAKQ